MKIHILLFICCMPAVVLADASFNEVFNTEINQHIQIADRIASYHVTDSTLDTASQQIELEALQKNIDGITATSPNEPLLWFISGLNQNNLAALFAIQDQQSQATPHIERRNLAYLKAMQLDSKPPLKLSATIYATMKYGLPAADKIKAIENEIKQGGSGESDDQLIQLHWSRVNALEKAGRHDDAQKALTEMQREITKLHLQSADYKSIVDRAQNEINTGRKTGNSKTTGQQDTITTINPDPGSARPSNNTLVWIIFFGVLAVLSVWTIVQILRDK